MHSQSTQARNPIYSGSPLITDSSLYRCGASGLVLRAVIRRSSQLVPEFFCGFSLSKAYYAQVSEVCRQHWVIPCSPGYSIYGRDINHMPKVLCHPVVAGNGHCTTVCRAILTNDRYYEAISVHCQEEIGMLINNSQIEANVWVGCNSHYRSEPRSHGKRNSLTTSEKSNSQLQLHQLH